MRRGQGHDCESHKQVGLRHRTKVHMSGGASKWHSRLLGGGLTVHWRNLFGSRYCVDTAGVRRREPDGRSQDLDGLPGSMVGMPDRRRGMGMRSMGDGWDFRHVDYALTERLNSNSHLSHLFFCPPNQALDACSAPAALPNQPNYFIISHPDSQCCLLDPARYPRSRNMWRRLVQHGPRFNMLNPPINPNKGING